MAANWCRVAWREWFARASRSRAGAVVLCAALGLMSARCIADFVTPAPGGGTSGNPPGPPGSSRSARVFFVVEPAGGAPGYPIDTVAVAAVDADGRPAAPTITLRLLGGSGASLGGPVVQAAAGGVAAFGGLVVDSAGSYRLLASASGFRPDTSRLFTIVQPPVAGIVLAPGRLTFVSLGQTAQVAAEARDSAGRPIGGVHVDWSTSDPGVAVVDASGQVTASGNGAATIRASSGAVSGTIDAVVSQVAASVALTPSSVSLERYDTQVLTAAATDARGNPVQRVLHYSWKSSKPRTVSVTADPSNSAQALVRRLEEHGSPTITATTEGASGSVTIH